MGVAGAVVAGGIGLVSDMRHGDLAGLLRRVHRAGLLGRVRLEGLSDHEDHANRSAVDIAEIARRADQTAAVDVAGCIVVAGEIESEIAGMGRPDSPADCCTVAVVDSKKSVAKDVAVGRLAIGLGGKRRHDRTRRAPVALALPSCR